jgi:hypothetical protein
MGSRHPTRVQDQCRQEVVDGVNAVSAPATVFDFTTKGHCRRHRFTGHFLPKCNMVCAILFDSTNLAGKWIVDPFFGVRFWEDINIHGLDVMSLFVSIY